ncbi:MULTISPECIES: DUF4352 domain-containing protein [Bacillaceae]|uniref:DUF4352 domain-containing protein n=1 Tax=Evansella alkalicola TaxID=745819 RepID=A0ABS6JWH2_9BACI|nr:MULTISPECIES: DUF4352 domain-containing protein [Bacillaceae]MBU9722936.1 DUF4352 domain-containing protein [Bacillus alkalicola]
MKKLLLLFITGLFIIAGCAEQATSTSADEGEFLALGETGAISNMAGDYEITVERVQRFEEYDGRTPAKDYFYLIDIEVVNTGDSVLIGNDIIRSTLVGDNWEISENWYSAFLKEIPEQLQPGESAEVELFFDQVDSESYRLNFAIGLAKPSSESRWQFSKGDIE